MQPIFAVVVAFSPNIEQLRKLCAVLSLNASVVVVDNTPEGAPQLFNEVCTWIVNGENLGIAKAQNIGIQEALQRSARSIAFFDQDSQVPQEMLPLLLKALERLGSGVVVPVSKDASTDQEYPSFRFNRLGWPVPVYLGQSQTSSPVDLAISSGSLVSVDLFDLAGVMDDTLFIDYVDFEWCARVRKKELPIHVVPEAVMRHSIGQTNVNAAGLHVFVHSPRRCYYRVRNAFHLFRYPHIPFLFAVHEVAAALVHHILQSRYSENPRLHLKMGWKGVKDGIAGRRGALLS